MRQAVVSVICAVVLAACGSTSSENYSRDPMPDVGNYPPPPTQLKPMRVAIVDFEDKAGEKVGKAAGEQLETLVMRSNRFKLIDRMQLKKILQEQGLEGIVDPSELAKPGKIRGVDYLFLGAITNFRVKVVRTNTGFSLGEIIPRAGVAGLDTSKTVVETQVGVDIKLVNTTTGEIVAKDFGECKREDVASAWGMRILGTGGHAQNEIRIDDDSKGKILRWALDESFKKMLPSIDDKFSRPHASMCPKCKVEVEAGNKFCSKCGTSSEPVKCKCGADVEAGVKFCGKCGAKVEPPK